MVDSVMVREPMHQRHASKLPMLLVNAGESYFACLSRGVHNEIGGTALKVLNDGQGVEPIH